MCFFYDTLSDPGEARGCSTNSLMINSFIHSLIQWVSLFLPQLYGAATLVGIKRRDYDYQYLESYTMICINSFECNETWWSLPFNLSSKGKKTLLKVQFQALKETLTVTLLTQSLPHSPFQQTPNGWSTIGCQLKDKDKISLKSSVICPLSPVVSPLCSV